LQYAGDELRQDTEVVATALRQNESAICYAAQHIREEAFIQDIMEESDDLVSYMKTLEASIFDNKMAEPSAMYLARRDELIKLIRALSKDLQVSDCWTHALTLLDAFHCVPRKGGVVVNDTAIAAVMLAGKMINGKLSYPENGAMVALHFGNGFELSDRDLRTLQSAEMCILSALGASLMLPSVDKWVEVIFRRMMVFSTTDWAKALREAAAIAQQVAEIVAVRVPASSTMSPWRLAVSCCALTLVGVGLLPASELPCLGAIDGKISQTFYSESNCLCCKSDRDCEEAYGEQQSDTWNWPKFETAGAVPLEVTVLARAAGIDAASLKSEVLSALYASGYS